MGSEDSPRLLPLRSGPYNLPVAHGKVMLWCGPQQPGRARQDTPLRNTAVKITSFSLLPIKFERRNPLRAPIYSLTCADSQFRALDSEIRSHDVSVQQESVPTVTDWSARTIKAAAGGQAQPPPQVPTGQRPCTPWLGPCCERWRSSSCPVSCVLCTPTGERAPHSGGPLGGEAETLGSPVSAGPIGTTALIPCCSPHRGRPLASLVSLQMSPPQAAAAAGIQHLGGQVSAWGPRGPSVRLGGVD